MRILCIFFFLSFIDTLFLYIWSCDHFYTYIVLILFICGCMFLSPTLTCVVSFLSLYTCFLCLYAIYYFCFTRRCLDDFCLKCFRKTSCQNLSYHELSSCKVFSRICVRIRCYCTQQVIMSLVIYDFSYTSFVCCDLVTDCQRGRLLRHM